MAKTYIDLDAQGYDNVTCFTQKENGDLVAHFDCQERTGNEIYLNKDAQAFDGFIGQFDSETSEVCMVKPSDTVTAGLRGTSKVRLRLDETMKENGNN